MLLNNPHSAMTSAESTTYSQTIESRHDGAVTFAGMPVVPTSNSAATVLLTYEGALEMPSKEKLAVAMRRMKASPETEDERILRLAASFAGDVNELLVVGE